VFACVNFILLLLWSTKASYTTTPAIVSATLSFTAALALCYLSYIEHSRSISPSSFLNIYLLVSLVPDFIQARWLSSNKDLHALVLVHTAGIGVKVLLLVLEAQSKVSYLKPAYQNLSPEVTEGIINRTFLWWINSLLKIGYRKLLSYEDLPVLDDKLSSARLRSEMILIWDGTRRLVPWAHCFNSD
jgi:ATP-binding cassette, subfamily C (CFTR/MRP), member 1